MERQAPAPDWVAGVCRLVARVWWERLATNRAWQLRWKRFAIDRTEQVRLNCVATEARGQLRLKWARAPMAIGNPMQTTSTPAPTATCDAANGPCLTRLNGSTTRFIATQTASP